MTRLAVFTAGLICSVVLATAARGDEYYTWVDEEGAVHFSEERPPTPGTRARKLQLAPDTPSSPEPEKEKPADEGAKAAAGRPQAAPAQPAPRARPAPSVVVYSTSWCPFCARTREYFRKKGVDVVEYDIEQDAAARARKIGLTGNEAVPTVVIGGAVIQGFRPADFDRALAR